MASGSSASPSNEDEFVVVDPGSTVHPGSIQDAFSVIEVGGRHLWLDLVATAGP